MIELITYIEALKSDAIFSIALAPISLEPVENRNSQPLNSFCINYQPPNLLPIFAGPKN